MDNESVWKIIDKYFQDNPQSLVRHHIESYNDFFKNSIFQIFKEKNPVRIGSRYDKAIDEYRSQCIMYYGGKNGDKIYFGKPVIYDDNESHYMYPNEARLRNMTYGMTIHYDIEVEFITILEDGEKPTIAGLEEDDEDDYEAKGGKPLKQKTMGDIAKEEEAKLHIQQSEDVPKQTNLLSGGAPKRKGKQKKRQVELSPAETALFKEAAEKSMIAPNTQKETITLEKIFLGKFPIMLQSNFCVLSGLPREVRHTMGECLNDVGGYFIIDGKEKTIVSQEKFGDNMLYIRESGDEKYLYSAEIRSVSENVSKPMRTLSVKIVAPSPSYTFKNIVVNIPNVRKPVPLFIVFRALGIISDKQIITTCLLDLEKYDNMVDLFAPSVQDAGGILTQRNALKYIATLTKGKTVSHALEILADLFLPHVGEMNFLQKAYYLGYMTFRLLSVYTGAELPTDRDNFKFKRIELVGSLMYDLFREYYTIQQRQAQLAFESRLYYNQAIYEKDLKSLILKNYVEVFRERGVEIGFKKGFKGNWGSQTNTKRIGVVQDLNRLSHSSMMSHLRKMNLPLDASVKLVGPRVLHSTQWGMFDPIDTPDGGNIGLHKHMAISAYVTKGISREPMIRWMREKIELKLLEECTPAMLATMTKVFINGLWAGSITDPINSTEKIRLYRRNGLLPIYTSATFDIHQNTIFVYTDAGRICRPIFYRDLESGNMSFENPAIMKKIKEGDFTWNELISGFNRKKDPQFHPNNYAMYELPELYEGVDAESNPAKLKRFFDEKAIIDYIDSSETEDTLIALSTEELDQHPNATHMEIHESLIFGMMCNMIIFPENNPATRNSFSCGQSKQACSLYHTNYQVRMDKTAVVLSYGQTPLVKSRYLEHINHESNPYGENAIVAIMCYTGYNVEDAVLINEGALKRGLFQTTYYSTYETHEEKSKSATDTIEKIFTNIENDISVLGKKPGYDYSKLDKYGMIRENTPLDDKTVLIGLSASSSSNKTYKQDMSKTPKKGQIGVVDKSFITNGEEGTRIAKVRVREVRIPNLGDKMASRSGQKGTVGLVIPEENMPFTKEGIRPDIIVNPHALPTRMTIGQLVECITGKACAMYGGFGDCTAFNNRGSKIGVFGDMLTGVGYHSSGNEILYNGMTGEQLETEIFIGPTYYMRLKHMVKDKINYRALGPRTALTRQPVSGRANDGGLRIGEMERDAVISHGASEFLRESMMERGDKYFMAVCNNTGMLAIFNPSKNIFMSPMADGPIQFTGSLDGTEQHIINVTKYGRNFSVICIPYSMKLLLQELQTMNIQMRMITEDTIEQIENMSFSRNINKLLHEDSVVTSALVKDIKAKAEMNTGNDVFKPPISKSPSFESTSPAFVPEYSPQSDTSSPQYNPISPEEMQGFEPRTPEEQQQRFIPSSPSMSPPERQLVPSSPSMTPPERQFVPSSPSMTPPGTPSMSPPDAEEKSNILSEQAKGFTIGEQVHFRGDSIPTRLWTVDQINDKFLRIVLPNTNEMPNMVTAQEIYRPGDFTFNSPYAESLQSFNGQSPSTMVGGAAHMQMPNQTPAINIKIMNGGNDFSADPLMQMGGNSNPANNVYVNDNQTIADKPVEPSKHTGGSAQTEQQIDFSKLVIKKTD
jgi:DNA-directed RNA polymerase II subunit RPB2